MSGSTWHKESVPNNPLGRGGAMRDLAALSCRARFSSLDHRKCTTRRAKIENRRWLSLGRA
eukprot:6272128-Lingulodinium_polyedra.AAC.1